MIEQEPIYVYMKGEGWFVSPYDLLTAVIGLWQITLTHREPEIGERWFMLEPGMCLSDLLKYFEEEWYDIFTEDEKPFMSKWHPRYHISYKQEIQENRIAVVELSRVS